MCFTIKSNTPPGKRIAYKKVSRLGRRSAVRGTAAYPDGAVVEAVSSKSPVGSYGRSIFRRAIGRQSEAGIYVWFLTAAHANMLTRDTVTSVYIRVRVNDKDFIAQGTDYHRGSTVSVATYRKVKVIGEV